MSAQKTSRSVGKPAARASTGIPGLGGATGKVGFKPWDKGQYALQIADSDDSKPTKSGDYMLKVRFTIIGQPDGVNGSRDPIGRTTFNNFVVIPETEYYDFQINNLKNYLNAAGVKVVGDSFDHRKAVGQKLAVNWGVKKNKATGLDEQAWNGFVPFAQSDFA